VKYARPVFVDRVAADFPNLKIVLCHLGNPWFADAAEVMSKNPNVMGGIDGLLTSEISPRYADYLDFLRRSLLDLFAFIGDIEDRFFFGSDWPVATPLQCLELINLLSLTKSERDNLLFSAAQKFYGLPDTISG
jgi:hypothetical protein